MTSQSTPLVDLSTVLQRQAERFEKDLFLSTDDGDFSWRETENLVARVAGGLLERGHGPGARVMTRGGGPLLQTVVWMACARLGAMWVPLNPLLTGRTARSVEGMADVHVVVDATLFEELADSGPVLSSAVVDPLSADPVDATSKAGRAWVKLMFTSGTTGQPKGVVWSRRCEAIWATAYARELLDVEEGDGLFTCLPLAHVTAQGTVAAALQRGAHLTLASSFDPFGFWDAVRAARACRFTFVGTILSTLLKRKPLPSDREHEVERAVGAGAPVATWQQIEDRFGLHIVETWGQTESAGCYTMPTSLPQRPGSIGRPTDRFEARIDVSVPAAADGELLLRPTESGAIFSGYLQEDGSLESPLDRDGWYRTGDRVRLADDGDLEFVVRERESIRRRGEIIPSAPIEEAAMEHPEVLEAAAIPAMRSEMADEEIKLFVVLDGDAQFDPVALHRFLRDQLPKFMVPRFIEVIGALPKTASTRVQKFKLDVDTETAWDARRRRGGTRGD